MLLQGQPPLGADLHREGGLLALDAAARGQGGILQLPEGMEGPFGQGGFQRPCSIEQVTLMGPAEA